MTAEVELPTDDGTLFCYRHPDRETRISCGRCLRPICLACSMQGPVGFRCRECGKPAYDPLTSFTPSQLAGGLAVSVIGGFIAAFVAARFGFFALIVAFFAGGLISQTITRITGYKMGTLMNVVVYGGIVAGSLGAFWIGYGDAIGLMLAQGAAAGAGDGRQGVGSVLASALLWAAIGAAVTCAGARSRMR